MPEQKQQEFDDRLLRIADIAKALSHPARLRILQMLWESDNCLCGEIVRSMPLAQATVSQHLNELKRVGIITSRCDPPKTSYCLNREVINEVMSLWSHILASAFVGEKKQCGA